MVTLHDAIVALAEEIALNENLTTEERLRWLGMLTTITEAASQNVIDAVDRLVNAVTADDACARFHPGEPCRPGDNHPGQSPTTVEAFDPDELGDDFGDDDLND